MTTYKKELARELDQKIDYVVVDNYEKVLFQTDNYIVIEKLKHNLTTDIIIPRDGYVRAEIQAVEELIFAGEKILFTKNY